MTNQYVASDQLLQLEQVKNVLQNNRFQISTLIEDNNNKSARIKELEQTLLSKFENEKKINETLFQFRNMVKEAKDSVEFVESMLLSLTNNLSKLLRFDIYPMTSNLNENEVQYIEYRTIRKLIYKRK